MKMKCKELGVHFIEGEVHNMAQEINTYRHFENTFEDELEDDSLDSHLGVNHVSTSQLGEKVYEYYINSLCND